MLDIAPNTHGLLAQADVARLKEMGDATKALHGPDKNRVPGKRKHTTDVTAATDNDRHTFWSAPRARTTPAWN